MKYHPMYALVISVLDLEHLGRVHRIGFDVVRASEEFRINPPPSLKITPRQEIGRTIDIGCSLQIEWELLNGMT
jgi:hypothetical protein